jgi:uncharacterized membrane protein YsdA (DUF1294 family)
MRGRHQFSLVYRYGLLTVVPALLLVLLLAAQPGWDFAVVWVAVFSAVAFLTYAYDKRIADSVQTRVPEKVLLLLAFLGGTPGALLGMQLLRHKTAKASFQQRFWLVVLLQIILIVAFLVIRRR